MNGYRDNVVDVYNLPLLIMYLKVKMHKILKKYFN